MVHEIKPVLNVNVSQAVLPECSFAGACTHLIPTPIQSFDSISSDKKYEPEIAAMHDRTV